MAGPVGRSAQAKTSATMTAGILAWSRSRGLFAGVALEGGTLRDDKKDNQEIYGKPARHEDILTGKLSSPAAAQPLHAALNKYAGKTVSRLAEPSSTAQKRN
jgi:lipid-binding SYLF domain-containing protein